MGRWRVSLESLQRHVLECVRTVRSPNRILEAAEIRVHEILWLGAGVHAAGREPLRATAPASPEKRFFLKKWIKKRPTRGPNLACPDVDTKDHTPRVHLRRSPGFVAEAVRRVRLVPEPGVSSKTFGMYRNLALHRSLAWARTSSSVGRLLRASARWGAGGASTRASARPSRPGLHSTTPRPFRRPNTVAFGQRIRSVGFRVEIRKTRFRKYIRGPKLRTSMKCLVAISKHTSFESDSRDIPG